MCVGHGIVDEEIWFHSFLNPCYLNLCKIYGHPNFIIPEFGQKGYMFNFSFFSTQLTFTYVMKGASIICKVKNRYYQKILIMLITLPAL